MAKATAKTTPIDPPRIRVRDLSWPLRVMISLAAAAGVAILLYVVLLIVYVIAASL